MVTGPGLSLAAIAYSNHKVGVYREHLLLGVFWTVVNGVWVHLICPGMITITVLEHLFELTSTT